MIVNPSLLRALQEYATMIFNVLAPEVNTGADDLVCIVKEFFNN